ncbi:MAG: hypothetical protein ACFFC7_12555 [Candidatus Hermodarchaeota archaeon]
MPPLDTDTLRLLIELTIIPPMQFILLFTAYHIAQKNWESTTNRYMALSLVLAATATVGTLVRTMLSWLAGPNYGSDYFLGEFERIGRHLDLCLVVYVALYLFVAFWFLFQEPETPLPRWIKTTSFLIFVWAIIESFYFSSLSNVADFVLIVINVLIIYFLVFLTFYLFRCMITQVPITKRNRILIFRRGLVLLSLGLTFLMLSSFLHYLGFRAFAMILDSFFTFIPWVLGAFYFHRGIPSREVYFFDELNQILVYHLQLPLDTSLDQIFQLIEQNLHLTKVQLSKELKNRKSVIQYIRELSESLKKDKSAS